MGKEEKQKKPSINLEESSTFQGLSNEALKLKNEQKNVDAKNRIEHLRNQVAVIIVGVALSLLIGLTINRGQEKDDYIADLRADKTIPSQERIELIKKANDEFHETNTAIFYNILIGATAYLLGASTTSKK